MRMHLQSRPLLTCFLGLFVFALSSAQEPTTAQNSASTVTSDVTGVTLHGTVLNSLTNQPIARALVTLEAYGLSMLTDNEGRFSFDTIPAGITTITCRRPGYGEAGSDVDAGGDRVQTSIQVGAGMAELTLELQPLASIAGQVLLSGDDPPEDLRVQLLQKRIHDGRGQWANMRSAQVSSDGHFRFGNLRPGSYVVHVAASMDPVPAPALTPNNLLDKPRTGYVATYAPGVPELAGAQVLVLGPGQQGETKIRVNRETYFPVTARVGGAPENGRMTFAVSGGSLLGQPARYSREDGLVHALLPSGHYALSGHSFEPGEMAGQTEFDVRGGPVSGLTIVLAPVSAVPVVIRKDFTATQGVQMNLGGMNPGVQVTLSRGDTIASGSMNVMHHVPTADVDAYELNSIQPGQYWAGTMVYSGYVAAMTSGGTDLLRQPLSVNASGGAQPIEVTLRNDYGSFTASLAASLLGGVGSAPGAVGVIPKVFVHLEPISGTAVERIEPMPASGPLQMSNVAPGEYLVFASASRGPVEYRNPSVLSALTGAGQAVTVTPGGTASATLQKLAALP